MCCVLACVDQLTGDEPEHSNPSTVDFFVARVAYQVFCEYQKQLLLDVDGEEEGKGCADPSVP